MRPTRSPRAADLAELASIFAPSLAVAPDEKPDPTKAHALGATLYQSLVLYGDPRKWRAWKVEAGDPDDSWRDDTIAVFAARLYRTEATKSWRELTTEVQWLLQKGTIVAFGYRVPRLRDAPPEPIPAEVWLTRDVDWGTGTVRGAGLEFADVRVIRLRPRTDSDTARKHSDVVRPGKGGGRPSMTTVVDLAIAELTAEGAFQSSRPGKAHYPAVRDRARRLAGLTDDTGMGDEVIRRRLRKQFP